MYDDAVFNIHWHDDEGDCHDSSYRAKKGGALYKGSANGALTAGCYQNPQTKSWYYFARNGYGYEGVHYIDGKKYNFSEGKMI